MYKGIVQLVIGLMMIVTLLVGYLPIPEYLVELTCVSNMLGGSTFDDRRNLKYMQEKNLSSNFVSGKSACAF